MKSLLVIISACWLIFPTLEARAANGCLRLDRAVLAANRVRLAKVPLAEVSRAKKQWEELGDRPNSVARRPYYLSATPREMVRGLDPLVKEPTLPSIWKRRATIMASVIQKKLGVPEAEFESWPAYDEFGNMSLVFARWRAGPDKAWEWLNAKDFKEGDFKGAGIDPILPQTLDPNLPADHARLFNKHWQTVSKNHDTDDLYLTPMGADGVWTTAGGRDAVLAWPDPRRLDELERVVTDSGYVLRYLPQPARHFDEPITFVLKGREGSPTVWPENVRFSSARPAPTEPLPPIVHLEFPADFAENYKKEVAMDSGVEDSPWPDSSKVSRFKRMNEAQEGHQLEEKVQYLKARYKQMNIPTVEFQIPWNGEMKTMVLAYIKGQRPSGKPVVFADHVDKAIDETNYSKNGTYESTPGADDNGTATAALLTGAPILREAKLNEDIWLVHFRGEEFPADCLGARWFVTRLLKGFKPEDFKDPNTPLARYFMTMSPQDIRLMLIDMIGHRTKGDRIWQINAGSTPNSQLMAELTKAVANIYASDLDATIRPADHPRNYGRQTDLEPHDGAGVDGVIGNEDISLLRKKNPLYHQTRDTPDRLDLDNYAAPIAKTFIATVASLAGHP